MKKNVIIKDNLAEVLESKNKSLLIWSPNKKEIFSYTYDSDKNEWSRGHLDEDWTWYNKKMTRSEVQSELETMQPYFKSVEINKNIELFI